MFNELVYTEEAEDADTSGLPGICLRRIRMYMSFFAPTSADQAESKAPGLLFCHSFLMHVIGSHSIDRPRLSCYFRLVDREPVPYMVIHHA